MGEITLHHAAVYIQVSQSALGGGMGILIRTCRGRRDYTGGTNNWAPLALLDDVSALAAKVAGHRSRPVLPRCIGVRGRGWRCAS